MTTTTETPSTFDVSATWTPSFSPWRHGGWYVDNVRYPSGAVGCVSRNYADGKWRIVCESSGTPFPSRDAAARAERVLAAYQREEAKKEAFYPVLLSQTEPV